MKIKYFSQIRLRLFKKHLQAITIPERKKHPLTPQKKCLIFDFIKRLKITFSISSQIRTFTILFFILYHKAKKVPKEKKYILVWFG